MDMSVLGPLEVQLNGASVVPSAAQPKSILALLVLRANRIVPIGDLERELWGGRPPRSSGTAIQTYVMRLRRTFAHVRGLSHREVVTHILRTHPGGYSLSADSTRLDLQRYDELSSAGSRALAEGELETAVRHLRQALDLWRGSVLADVRVGFFLEMETARLELSRVATQVQCLEAEVRLGRDFEVLNELAALTAHHHLNEALHSLYMTVLYRTGFRHESLLTYERYRTALVDELGLEPSEKMRRLHQAVLGASSSSIDDLLHGRLLLRQ